MRRIRSIIIDDEAANRNLLGNMLKEHCPSVELIGNAASVEEGYLLICSTKPDLVFLDIQILAQTGFDLLRMFDEISFQVIFVTAFCEYAIQAFEFNVTDYILKPIDYTKLVRAVKKVECSIRFDDNSKVIHFIQSADERDQFIKSIPLHQKDKVLIVELESISHIQAVRNYCEIITEDNQRILSTKPLCYYDNLLEPYPSFLRINKSLLINIHHISTYSKGMECIITMKNGQEDFEVSRRKKTEILRYLKG